jgi:hypothetical protein
MKKMELKQMEQIEGGTPCSSTANKFIAVTGLIAGVASSFGPIGLAIAGPTALGMGVASIICAWKE